MDCSYASSSAHTLDDDIAVGSRQPNPSGESVTRAIEEEKQTSPAAQYYPPSTPHLNPNNLLILSHQSRGRGVYASRPLPAGTVVEISPVLIFGKDEWEQHGSRTILDCYTFKWGRMGEMALALGLGSLFNHSASPSVAFKLDRPSHSIRYTLVRDVVAGEELCISYGPWGQQYEEGSSNPDSGDVSDYDDRKERELADFLKIGEERSDSEGETSSQRPGVQRKVVRRTRTRYINGNSATKPSNSNTGSGSDSGLERTSRSSDGGEALRAAVGSHLSDDHTRSALNKAMDRRESNGPSSISQTSVVTVNGTSAASSSAPVWRLSSLPDPMTVPLQMLSCYALLIPPRSSSEIMKFLRKHSLFLGRGKVPGSEEDAIRHAKTLMKHPDDNGNLRSLLCPAAHVDEAALKQLLKEDGLMDAEERETKLLRVDVASTPAPIKTRATEWSASWPVALRSMANSSNSAAVPSPGTPSQGGGTSTPSAIHASTRPGFIDRKIDAAFWSEKRVHWVIRKLARCVVLAQDAKDRGEIPVGVHVCPSILSTAIASNGGTGVPAAPSSTAASEYVNHSGTDAVTLVPPPSSSEVQGSGSVTLAAPWYGGWDSDGIPLPGGEAIEVDAFDTRKSQRNPIKHAVGNAIQGVAELRAYKRGAASTSAEQQPSVIRGRPMGSEPSSDHSAEQSISPVARLASNGDAHADATMASSPHTALTSLSPSPARPASPSLPLLLNGQDYLLTSLTLFTTHEPCVYCCMSLVHSRVRTLIFLESSSGSGGCCGSQLPDGKRCNDGLDEGGEGGPYALQEQRGLNHRFEVWKWRGGRQRIEEEVARLRGERQQEEDLANLLDLKRWGNIDP
ncbi:hypothetical protein BCV69DRAFT_35809 [Microstroma glucosiphilum]|uniref:SET domain-containing protein n=1 Tax=Pseudomicrostroma glucosiphilum TaxID=1684307 RepID=A0A316U679_9BASI|nr:hypothetical protein BCV69DRAFT_35809 [Pseudomicrostroma glucosiphilum]PWN19843.1 hypothetical protein BCV69DRAFT_35809 [Pseudomicrostroma glucosiphilum]